jgi:hypothetical protein
MPVRIILLLVAIFCAITAFSASLLAADESAPPPAPATEQTPALEPATPDRIDPELMAQGVRRMIAEEERKDHFWQFLQDNQRYMGMLLGAFLILIFALKKQVDSMEIEGVWTNILIRSVKTLVVISAILASIGFAVFYLLSS